VGVITCRAQLPAIDSLEQALLTNLEAKTRVDLMTTLADRYLPYLPAKANQYANAALVLSQQIGYRHGEVLALNRLAEYEFRQSNYAQAVERATESLRLAEKWQDSLGIALAYRVLGNTHTFGFKQYDLALQYQLRAFEFYKRLKDKSNIAAFCGNITWIYASTNQNLEEAHRLANLGIHLSDSLNHKQLLSYNYNSKGLIFMQENQPDSALKYLNLSIREAESAKDAAVVAYNKLLIGKICLNANQAKEALNWLQQALDESRKMNLREVVKEALVSLSKSYSLLGNHQRAYTTYMNYSLLKDSLVNWETSQRALLTKLQFDEEKREAKIAQLELANQQARKEQLVYSVTFAVVFLLMAVMITLVVRNNRIRAETNQLLRAKNEEINAKNEKLTQANNLKDRFFSIIGHDLRSPLVSLKGLLGMLLRNDISEEEFRMFAPKLNQLVIGTNETLENLLQWSYAQMKGWTFNLTTLWAHDLAAKCITLFTEAAKGKSITLENKVDKDALFVADRNHVEMILRNLVHNAIKFTNPGGRVTLSAKQEAESFRISVADTGTGMTAEQVTNLFSTEPVKTLRGTQGERGTGLGLMLCKEMLDQLGGYIEVESKPGRGSVFHVFFKKQQVN